MIQITRTEDGIEDIQIDGQSLETDDGEHFTVPRALLAGIPVRDLPTGARFAVCERIEDDVVYIDEVALTLQRTNDEVLATVEDMARRKFWDGQVGLNVYMEAKRALQALDPDSIIEITANFRSRAPILDFANGGGGR